MKKIKSPPLEKEERFRLSHQDQETISDDQRPPIFSLEYLDADYCVTKCEKNDKAAFADKLKELSSLSWRDLRQAPRHGLGPEKISREQIKGKMPKIVTDDVRDFLAFRFSGRKPMVGLRHKAIFYILWLDRNFTLYDHGS